MNMILKNMNTFFPKHSHVLWRPYKRYKTTWNTQFVLLRFHRTHVILVKTFFYMASSCCYYRKNYSYLYTQAKNCTFARNYQNYYNNYNYEKNYLKALLCLLTTVCTISCTNEIEVETPKMTNGVSTKSYILAKEKLKIPLHRLKNRPGMGMPLTFPLLNLLSKKKPDGQKNAYIILKMSDSNIHVQTMKIPVNYQKGKKFSWKKLKSIFLIKAIFLMTISLW